MDRLPPQWSPHGIRILTNINIFCITFILSIFSKHINLHFILMMLLALWEPGPAAWYSLAVQRWSGSSLACDSEQLGSGHVTWEGRCHCQCQSADSSDARSRTVNSSNDPTTTALISTSIISSHARHSSSSNFTPKKRVQKIKEKCIYIRRHSNFDLKWKTDAFFCRRWWQLHWLPGPGQGGPLVWPAGGSSSVPRWLLHHRPPAAASRATPRDQDTTSALTSRGGLRQPEAAQPAAANGSGVFHERWRWWWWCGIHGTSWAADLRLSSAQAWQADLAPVPSPAW